MNKLALLFIVIVILTQVSEAMVVEYNSTSYSVPIMVSRIFYVPLNNTFAVAVVKFLIYGTVVTIYENGHSVTLYCRNITVMNVTSIKAVHPFSNSSSSVIIHVKNVLGENFPCVGIFVYKDYLIVEFSPNHENFRFYVFNSRLNKINEFEFHNTACKGTLGISGKYLLYFDGKINYKNITIIGCRIKTFLRSFLFLPIYPFKNSTVTRLTIPVISNITVFMYNMLTGNIKKEIYLKNVSIYEYPSLILIHNVTIMWYPLFVSVRMNDFIYNNKILDLETICYGNSSVNNVIFYTINLCNGKISLSPKFNIWSSIMRGDNLIAVILPNRCFGIFINPNETVELYTPNFTFLGKVNFSPPLFIPLPILLIPEKTEVYSPYDTITNFVYYDGYIYLNNCYCTLILHNNQSIRFKNAQLFFLCKPIVVEKEAKGYTVMELDGDKILKCLHINAEYFSTQNSIIFCKIETIYKNSTYKINISTNIYFLGIGNFIIFHEGNSSIIVTLPNLNVINLSSPYIIGVYDNSPVLVNVENLMLNCKCCFAFSNITFGKFLDCNTADIKGYFLLLIISILVLVTIVGAVTLKKLMS